MIEQKGVCFLGTGKIVAKHAGLLRALRPRWSLAVASRDAERAKACAKRIGAKDHFGSYQQAIASAYECLVIATPPRQHAELVRAALAQQKHLLIEKPAFNSLDEFVELWPALKASQQVVLIAENVHYAPFHRRLRRCLLEAELGRPLIFELTRFGRQDPSGWRADPEQMPLGALHEGGVHWIRRLLDLAAAFEDEAADAGVVDVSAFGPAAPLTATPGEDTMMVIARHRSGLTSRLLHSWALPWRGTFSDSSRLLFEHGAAYFDARGVHGRVFSRGKKWLLPKLRDAGGYRAMWADFLEAIDGQRAPALSLEQVFADFAYLDAAYRSKRSQLPERPRTPAG